MEVLFRYKGYIGTSEYDSFSCVYHGKLIDIDALVTYEVNERKLLRTAFEEAVDDYIESIL